MWVCILSTYSCSCLCVSLCLCILCVYAWNSVYYLPVRVHGMCTYVCIHVSVHEFLCIMYLWVCTLMFMWEVLCIAYIWSVRGYIYACVYVHIPASYMKFSLLAMCEHAWLCVFMHKVPVLPVYMTLYKCVYVHTHVHVWDYVVPTCECGQDCVYLCVTVFMHEVHVLSLCICMHTSVHAWACMGMHARLCVLYSTVPRPSP